MSSGDEEPLAVGTMSVFACMSTVRDVLAGGWSDGMSIMV